MTLTNERSEPIRLPRPLEPVRLPERRELIDWAGEHLGIKLSTAGRIPEEVIEKYVGYRLRARKRLIRQGRVI